MSDTHNTGNTPNLLNIYSIYFSGSGTLVQYTHNELLMMSIVQISSDISFSWDQILRCSVAPSQKSTHNIYPTTYNPQHISAPRKSVPSVGSSYDPSVGLSFNPSCGPSSGPSVGLTYDLSIAETQKEPKNGLTSTGGRLWVTTPDYN